MLRLLGVLENPREAHSISRQVNFLFQVAFPLGAFELSFRFPFSIVSDVVGPSAFALIFVLQLGSVISFVDLSLLVELIFRFSLVVLYQVGVRMLGFHAAAATVVSLLSSLLRFVFVLLVVSVVFECLGRHCFFYS